MNIDIEKALEESKSLMTNPHIIGVPRYDDYSYVYFSTTENIKAYLKNELFNKGTALTVLGSGDQVFNLVCNGVYNIDTFDINKLTYFNYFFKQAMIYNYSYDQYINFVKTFLSLYINSKTIKKEFNDLKKYMPKIVADYFDELIVFNNKLNDNSLYAHKNYLKNIYINSNLKKLFNLYLTNEEEYNKLKKELYQLKINFMFDNALNIPNNLNKKYDIILLSNISDYLYLFKKNFNHQDFNNYINSYVKYLNNNGILINYIFDIEESPFVKESTDEELKRVRHIYDETNFNGYYVIHKNM